MICLSWLQTISSKSFVLFWLAAGLSMEGNTEVSSLTQQLPAALCPCGQPAHKSCKAPGCSERYCRQCLNHLDATKAFQACDWLCCQGRTLYCPKHRAKTQVVVRCSACKHMWCKDKNAGCDQWQQAVCEHCLDDHQERLCPSLHGSQTNAAAMQNAVPVVC